MPPVVSPLKALARLSSRGQHGLGPNKYGLASWRRCVEGGRRLERFAPTRSLRSVVRLGNPCIDKLVDADKVFCNSFRDSYSSAQTRWFLGCGDGEEGNVLSKTHEERRVMGYSPEQLFGVVAAVDLYEDFLPWCQHSRIIRRNNDGSFDAELEIGFKFLVESYISHVELEKPKSIKVALMFFKEVVSRLVDSFSDRCRRIYGPGIRVSERPYGQGL
ncbi:uncharacterized protein [Elaeis guineensis]|uniref:Coenzyme Q-binding protein COQ10 homolog A, mitochondrial isoform X3 n=1 Tax=Elaeis guineensis var. tenera TaxID=51953 RepID=A0A6I9R1G9_ELAGV|nr:coenzyme Q-binding protein COQ10 homolog A, mitochondrial isoform X3 [Elaeis guineensis]